MEEGNDLWAVVFFFFLLRSTDTIEETVTVGVADGHSNVLTYVTCTICMPLSNG